MKKILSALLMTVFAIAAARTTPLIIDHTCTDITKIPDAWITQAKSQFKITYQHTSHGSQLVSGITALKTTHGGVYDFTYSGWGYSAGTFLNDHGMPDASDLGHTGDLTWKQATINMLNRSGGCNRNLVIWSWCGGCSDNTTTGMNAYLNAMNDLENTFAARNIQFVYMTGHLDGSGSTGNLHQMNNLIRNYCLANNKILFDFADIESYSPGGNTNFMTKLALDNTQYDANNNNNPWDDNTYWTKQWLDQNPGSSMVTETANCTECAHSDNISVNKMNCILKGRAFWWMLARLAGWDNSSSVSSNLPLKTELSGAYPNPFNPETTISYTLAGQGLVKLTVFNSHGAQVAEPVNQNMSAGKHSTVFNGRDLNSGVYFYTMTLDGRQIASKKIILIK